MPRSSLGIFKILKISSIHQHQGEYYAVCTPECSSSIVVYVKCMLLFRVLFAQPVYERDVEKEASETYICVVCTVYMQEVNPLYLDLNLHRYGLKAICYTVYLMYMVKASYFANTCMRTCGLDVCRYYL